MSTESLEPKIEQEGCGADADADTTFGGTFKSTVDGTAIDDTPVESAPVEPSLFDSTFDGTPSESSLFDGAFDGTPSESSLFDGTFDGTPSESSLFDGAFDGTPSESSLFDSTPVEPSPVDSTPVDPSIDNTALGDMSVAFDDTHIPTAPERLISVAEQPYKRDWTLTLALSAIVMASAGWLILLFNRGISAEALPWNLTLLALIAAGAVHLCGSCQQSTLAYCLRFAPDEHKRKSHFTPSFALSYLLTSIALLCWSIVPEADPTAKKLVQRQVIDIELVSHADAQDKHDILPGTVEQEQQRKRSGTADKTVQASLTPLVPNSRKATPAAEPNSGVKRPNEDAIKPDNKEKLSAQRHQVASASQKAQNENQRKAIQDESSPQELTELKPTFIVHKADPSTLAGKGFQNGATLVINPLRNNAPHVAAQRSSSQQTMDLEEVTPMEMVELTDNAGDQSDDVWQAGGRSVGGTGAPNEMQKYLKELNRRIKRAWTPPQGQSRRAQILFRINRNGRLAQIKLIASCGDEATDASALQAVVSASPFKALPEEFHERVLDVQYTFNYKVDELTEVRNARWQ